MDKLNKKYGFWTATAMVVGIVIGSGVFFKADDVLIASGGALPTALLAWLIGGLIMIFTAYVFSKIATKIEKVNGIVDYFEAAYGKKGGYNIAWFTALVYYPTITAVLAWVSGNYTISLLDLEEGVWIAALIYLLLIFLINILSPLIAGYFQVTTTLIKLIPLVAVAIIGTITGLLNGQTIDSFTSKVTEVSNSGGLAVATLSTAFAYEGWIIATTINSEIRDAKRNLPKALVFGTILIVVVYIMYYLGISSIMPNSEVINYGDNTSMVAISRIFGNVGGTLLSIFVVVSCLGTLNGLMMGAIRGFYSFASRDFGPKPKIFGKVNKLTGMPLYSAFAGLVLTLLWLIVWYGSFNGWYKGFMDISELPIAFLYVIYIALHIWVIKEFKELNIFQRFISPIIASLGSLYIIYGAIRKDLFIAFTIIVIVIQLTGLKLRGKKG